MRPVSQLKGSKAERERKTSLPLSLFVQLLEKEMATHSNILAWRIPWTEEPGRLQSMGHKSQT